MLCVCLALIFQCSSHTAPELRQLVRLVKCCVPIANIMSAASWVADSTFHKFYKRDIGQVQDKGDVFGQAILLDATH